ncbi:MAG TPA: DNA-deoxyinosine glycosylase [Candidatus Cryosericum sp.]|nr:DNA-deoxyinosine glycosylase [Candidatus Cryosericum sp.]
METVFHNIPPVFSPESEILILGTMPSPKSREAAFYYAHPQNRFWPVLARVYGVEPPKTIAEKTALLLEHRLALWDVLQSCDIIGASDASIKNPVANDIPALIRKTQITRVLCTGSTSARLYRALVEPITKLPCTALPSPSAANAKMTLQALAAVYASALLG